MPFGLTNAPTTFQSTMNQIFKNELRHLVLVFFDGILVYSKSWDEHLQHLESVLEILEQQQFFAKMSKCEFAMTKNLYLGHIIGRDGVKVDLKNIAAIQRWPIPTNLTELRGFIGLCNYYTRFIRGFSSLAAPLLELTKKGALSWSKEAHAAYEKLKEVMSSTPLLAIPDFLYLSLLIVMH